jgi:hypothetical protein
VQQDMKLDDGDPISTAFVNRRGEKREREGNERTENWRGLTLSSSAGNDKWLSCNESGIVHIIISTLHAATAWYSIL